MMTEKHSLILFAHGSSEPSWAAPFEKITAKLRDKIKENLQEKCRARHFSGDFQLLPIPYEHVTNAYLERMSPTLLEAIAAQALLGATHITIAPMFWGVGKHLRADLAELLAQAQQQCPALRFEVLPALGESEAVLDLLTAQLMQTTP